MASGPNARLESDWELGAPAAGLSIVAAPDALRIRRASLYVPGRKVPKRVARLAASLPTLLPQLMEMGLAVDDGSTWAIEYSVLPQLRADHEIDVFEGLTGWVPWPLEVESAGIPGTAEFALQFRFYSGKQPVYPQRRGCFLRTADRIYQLDRQSYALVDAIDQFRLLDPNARCGPDGLVRFGEIKGLAEEVGAELDRFVRRETIIVPKEIGVGVEEEGDGRISLVPAVDGVPSGPLKDAFLNEGRVPAVYSFPSEDGGRIRLVLNPAQREAVARMQRARHLAGREKAAVLADPARQFDGVGDVVKFGPRVLGIGDFPFSTQLFVERHPLGIFDLPATGATPGGNWHAGIRCLYADGGSEDVRFETPAEAKDFCRDVEKAHRDGLGTVAFRGKTVLASAGLAAQATALLTRLQTPGRPRSAAPGKYLLIKRNDGVLDYEESTGQPLGPQGGTLPRSLLPDSLKPHQADALAWLQRSFLAGRRGCLLADDMGLGKTLETLSFLAWLIESGETALSADPERGPWRPILIVAPLTLIESENWQNDMRRFFKGNGAVFQPWTSLHGKVLQDFRITAGAETTLGSPTLDLARLRNSRVLLTNYETVVRYQHSLAAMTDKLAVVVTDEAQEAKTPDTKISHALKGLAPQFRIACTGTPVETRLLDLWNIVDYLQPGPLLGSARDFLKGYALPEAESDAAAGGGALARLRKRLRLNEPDAYVLRRDKRQLPDLPAKHEHVIDCELSTRQREEHLATIRCAHGDGPREHPFRLLARLMALSQHPALVPHYDPIPPKTAVEDCPKLAAVLEKLASIQKRGEKVLLFTRSIDMQQILQGALQWRFDLRAGIVNGAAPRTGDTNSSKRTRREILESFQGSAGFNVVILSPDVAGLGLNLCEANHVIHYGRWWNPAKEEQATDRVYRLGQTRDVHVYYPVARDPLGGFRSFDEKLNRILSDRKQMAAEFLAPGAEESAIQEQLLTEVLGEPAQAPPGRRIDAAALDELRWDDFEALMALLQSRRGAAVILTQVSGDDKVDVLALNGREMRLVQCKHSVSRLPVDSDAITEILSAVDIYRHRYLRPLEGRCSLRLLVASNGSFTRAAVRLARENGVELLAGADIEGMLQETPCTKAEVAAMESSRLASMARLSEKIQALAARL